MKSIFTRVNGRKSFLVAFAVVASLVTAAYEPIQAVQTALAYPGADPTTQALIDSTQKAITQGLAVTDTVDEQLQSNSQSLDPEQAAQAKQTNDQTREGLKQAQKALDAAKTPAEVSEVAEDVAERNEQGKANEAQIAVIKDLATQKDAYQQIEGLLNLAKDRYEECFGRAPGGDGAAAPQSNTGEEVSGECPEMAACQQAAAAAAENGTSGAEAACDEENIENAIAQIEQLLTTIESIFGSINTLMEALKSGDPQALAPALQAIAGQLAIVSSSLGQNSDEIAEIIEAVGGSTDPSQASNGGDSGDSSGSQGNSGSTGNSSGNQGNSNSGNTGNQGNSGNSGSTGNSDSGSNNNGSSNGGSAPQSSGGPARLVARITGANTSVNKFGIVGTDLGQPFDIGNGKTGFLFGDTFESPTPANAKGGRANVMLRSSTNPSNSTITFESAAGVNGNGFAPALVPRINGEAAVIPNDGIMLSGKIYMSYMSVNNWNNTGSQNWATNFSGLAVSNDGNKFQRINTQWNNDGSNNDPYQMVSMHRDGDYVYLISVKAGRKQGPMILRRVAVNSITNTGSYQCWNGSSWGGSCKALFTGRYGEPSLRKLKDGVWAMAYLNISNGTIVSRIASQPTGPWSSEKRQVSISQHPNLYGGFIHPQSTSSNATFIVSSWVQNQRYDVSQYRGSM